MAADRGGSEPQVLERVHELPQLGRRDGVGAAGALGGGMPGEPPDVAGIVAHGVGAGPGLEGEIVPEPLQVKGSVGGLERDGHGTRVVCQATNRQRAPTPS